MATSSTHFCKLCEEDDVTIEAESWCLECKEWLCTDCKKHHERSKLSKQHKTVTVSVYKTLPSQILKISDMCTQHHSKSERFCSFHGVLCCIQCVREGHKECELSPLADVLENVKESAAVSRLERDLNELGKNFEAVEKHLSERITKVHDQKKQCLDEIKRVRTAVNDHLDRIEKNILDELSQKEKDIKKTIESLTKQIESRKSRVIDLQDSFMKTKQYANNLQLFLTIKEMEKQTYENTQYLEVLEKKNLLHQRNLNLVVTKQLQSFQEDVVAFGKISEILESSTFKLTKASQGQAVVPFRDVFTLDQIKPFRISTLHFSDRDDMAPQVVACAILKTGECVFADFNNDCVMLYDSKGTYIRDILELYEQPLDICCMNDSVIGITFYNLKKIHFIDVSKNKIENTIQFKSECHGIDCNAGKLFVRAPDEGTLTVMDLNCQIVQNIHIPGEEILFIAVHKNNIYCTDSVQNEVLCYNINGKIVWKHQYEKLRNPMNITIDKRTDIIYVLGRNNILAISLDGSQSKVVLSENDSLNGARSIFVSTDSKLLVCHDDSASLYQL